MEYFINRSVNAMPSSSIPCVRETKPAQASLLSFDFLFSTQRMNQSIIFSFLWVLDEYSHVSCIKDNSSYQLLKFFMQIKSRMCQTGLPGHRPKEYILVHDITFVTQL